MLFFFFLTWTALWVTKQKKFKIQQCQLLRICTKKHFLHSHLLTNIPPPSHRITISKLRELLSVANQEAAHPLLSGYNLLSVNHSHGSSPAIFFFSHSHTVGNWCSQACCAGVQITLSVPVRLSKKQDINAGGRVRAGSELTKRQSSAGEESCLERRLEKTHACGGCYIRVCTQETIWLELRVSCVCPTDLVYLQSHTHECKFSVFVLVSVHTAHGCASFSKYELSPIDKLKRRAGSGHINSALLEYIVHFSACARMLLLCTAKSAWAQACLHPR